MNKSVKLTAKDICSALDVRKHRFRTWVETLPPFCSEEVKPRSARLLSSQDLLFFFVIKDLEDNYGLKLRYLKNFSGCLFEKIGQPKPLTLSHLIYINVSTFSVALVSTNRTLGAGLLLDVTPAWQLMEEFFGLSADQQDLPFGLMAVDR